MGFTRNIDRDRAVLGSLLQRLGLPAQLASLLLAHAGAVADASDRLGLVSSGDRATIVVRHTCDSLLFAAAKTPRPGERWADVGSGAGFPGLVLACCYPMTRFWLIEPHGRKAGFLELQVNGLGLSNVEVSPRRLQEVDGAFDVAVARAFANPGEALLDLKSAVRVGGTALVAAGRDEPTPPGSERVELAGFGDVDSPGVLFMMGREA